MCAIAGIIGLPADEKTLGAMLQSMHRRGPDAEGIYSAEEATLLHARLIIRDPEGGKQPMHLTWAGEKYTIVYNGELYNTEEIRKEQFDNPSVKNQRFLPAPFTQGSRRCSRTSSSIKALYL